MSTEQEGPALAVPTIHLNGTSREALIAQLEATHQALETALRALAEGAPNARDYYVQPVGTWERARDQHNARMANVRRVQQEIVSIWEAIAE